MDNRKSILLGILGIIFSIGSGIVGLLSLDDKNRAIDRKVNAAVDKKIKEIQNNTTEEKEA